MVVQDDVFNHLRIGIVVGARRANYNPAAAADFLASANGMLPIA